MDNYDNNIYMYFLGGMGSTHYVKKNNEGVYEYYFSYDD
jgi:hypothetical protein